jgi:hypothetical protein
MDASLRKRGWLLLVLLGMLGSGCTRPTTRGDASVPYEMAQERAGPPKAAPALGIPGPAQPLTAGRRRRHGQAYRCFGWRRRRILGACRPERSAISALTPAGRRAAAAGCGCGPHPGARRW